MHFKNIRAYQSAVLFNNGRRSYSHVIESSTFLKAVHLQFWSVEGGGCVGCKKVLYQALMWVQRIELCCWSHGTSENHPVSPTQPHCKTNRTFDRNWHRQNSQKKTLCWPPAGYPALEYQWSKILFHKAVN